MSTKTSRPCRANNPKICPHHGTPVELNQATVLQSKIQAVLATPDEVNPRLLASSQLIDNAATSSLKWEGEQPTWWAEYKRDSENHELVPTTAELIDIIDSPEGKLAVVWQNESQREMDSGISLGSGYGTRICYFKSVETGKTLGFVNMAYMDKDSVERTFGNDEMTPYRWNSRYGGTRYPFERENQTYGDRDLKDEALKEQRRKVWVVAARDARRTIRDADGDYVSYYNINESHIPDDATVEKDLKEFAAPIKKEMRNAKNYYSTPYVDYSEVEKPLKGQGYGTALYVYTARMLAKEGKVLRGSGLQSDDAQKIWGRFKEKFPNNVSSINQNYKGQKSQAPIFDFREKG
jgi:hypothetical protein